MSTSARRYNILLVSDFYYPRLGGVELHEYCLAQALQCRGHSVCILTGTYTYDKANVTASYGSSSHHSSTDDASPSHYKSASAAAKHATTISNSYHLTASTCTRQGVRYMTNGLKSYYLPVISLHQQATLPTLCNFPSILHSIIQREQIDVVHSHQATSALGHEALLHASTMGCTTIYTDHSLFGLNSFGSIHLNKLLQFTLSLADRCIAVSYCTKQNLAIRANIDPQKIHVIPNAIDSYQFQPVDAVIPTLPPQQLLYVVVLSRLVYRKGVELLIDVIPPICARYSHVRWIIGGDGNKQVLVEEMRDRYNLHERVELLGAVRHGDVPTVLSRGHIFLNTSLTESFCMAICEAVSCGLYVVSTNVGGIPEVLPSQYIQFADCDSKSLIQELSLAIDNYKDVDRWQQHRDVAVMYNWHTVAERTEQVYNEAHNDKLSDEQTLIDRLQTVYDAGGTFSSVLWVFVLLANYMYHQLLNRWYPVEETDLALKVATADVDCAIEAPS